jgi:hypothetical protein
MSRGSGSQPRKRPCGLTRQAAVKPNNPMPSNHTRFFAAINEKKMVGVRFYSETDHGVLDRICAPMSYGQGTESHDELNRYWLWNYAGAPDAHVLGLTPEQIVDLRVLGEVFDPRQFVITPRPVSVSQTGGLPLPTVVSSGGATSPRL